VKSKPKSRFDRAYDWLKTILFIACIIWYFRWASRQPAPDSRTNRSQNLQIEISNGVETVIPNYPWTTEDKRQLENIAKDASK
jgi:hypothetical protein